MSKSKATGAKGLVRYNPWRPKRKESLNMAQEQPQPMINSQRGVSFLPASRVGIDAIAQARALDQKQRVKRRSKNKRGRNLGEVHDERYKR